MGEKALNAVKDGDIEIVPKRFEKTWYNWLENVHDWCVSRQLWWGHRIPVYYIEDEAAAGEGEYVVARDEEEARDKASELFGYDRDSVVLRQEEDVLDTWFSSGLWPFATTGWPETEVEGSIGPDGSLIAGDIDPSSDLARFYPGTCLETGYDILFFWVARMAMMGIELTGKVPFDVVYLHGLVRATDGTKMSKTKGNVIDPLDTVAQYGADSLRYSLVTGVTPGQDIPLNMEKLEANRNFANKLWNCCKFVTGNALGDDLTEQEWSDLAVTGTMSEEEMNSLPLPERYIVSECHSLIAAVTHDIESYNLGSAGSKVYEFLWDKFADWYIEISKTRLYEGAGGGDPEEMRVSRRVLVYILDTSLRLLHPYMPYVTEHLWHHLPRSNGDRDKHDDDASSSSSPHSLMLASWPQTDDDNPPPVDRASVIMFESFQSLTRSIRNARAEYNVEPGKKISARIIVPPDNPLCKQMMESELRGLVLLAKLDPEDVSVIVAGTLEADELIESEEGKTAVRLIAKDGMEAYLPLSGLIDPVKERERLDRRGNKLDKEIVKLKGRLGSKGFVDKAPVAVVDAVRDELKELEDQMGKIQEGLDALP